jgi:hypothetical protein
MAIITKWSNVAVSVQSAIAATKTITAITKASPGVVSSTAHGYSNGDYVLLTISGMYQLNYRVMRVSAVATDSFSLEGEDTTNYSTFVSGTAQKITFGTTLATLTNINASGGDFDFIDTTTIHDSIKTQIPGLANPSTYSFELLDLSDTGLIAPCRPPTAGAARHPVQLATAGNSSSTARSACWPRPARRRI